jgi:hypothetical protein
MLAAAKNLPDQHWFRRCARFHSPPKTQKPANERNEGQAPMLAEPDSRCSLLAGNLYTVVGRKLL